MALLRQRIRAGPQDWQCPFNPHHPPNHDRLRAVVPLMGTSTRNSHLHGTLLGSRVLGIFTLVSERTDPQGLRGLPKPTQG
jgi:hypothetical protein